MQNFITTAGIGTRSGTIFDKGPFVAGKKQDFFTPSHRIAGCGDCVIDLLRIRDNFTPQAQPFSDA
jgi:hypothetical protein